MSKIKNSLIIKIIFAYLALMLVNLIFFSVIIVENQTDLIVTNFKRQADNLAKNTLSSLKKLKISQEDDDEYKKLQANLKGYDLNWYKVFDTKANVWHSYPNTLRTIAAVQAENQRIKKEVLQKIQQLSSSSSLFQARYLIDLSQKDFSVRLFLPLSNTQAFLFASLNLKSMQERLALVYYQVIGAVIWGIIFHALFAVFLIRVIFRRIAQLVSASKEMGGGDLSARVKWKMDEKKRDELDTLGASFNEMASSIQNKVETITKLNYQIQQELKVGKEVQNLLLSPPEEVIKMYKPQAYYRPLREVSGDMYHYFYLEDTYRGVFFADASGHGVPAALVTAISFLSLEDVLARSTVKEKIISELNKSIVKRMEQAFYLTAALLLFDKDGKLWTTNAGHNTFFILSPDGSTREIESDGLPVGILPEAEYPMKCHDINKGDRIFIYTDGLIETSDANKEEFGMDRLKSALSQYGSAPIDQMAKALKMILIVLRVILLMM